MQKVFTRSVTLLRADSISAAVKPSSISAPNVEAEDLFPSGESNSTQFEVLGQPGLIARANTQPSVPLLIRRGCLVSLFSSSNLDSISMSHQWNQPWSKLLRYGSLKPAIFHKLDSDDPFHCLIAPNTSGSSVLFRLGLQSSSLQTICSLTLDGTADWFVLGKNSILAYEDNGSLSVNDAPLRLPTKKYRTCIGSRYQQLQGRGNALVSAPGTIYKIDLVDKSEEIIIRAHNLLAVNGINPLEIKENIQRFDLHPPAKAPAKPAAVVPSVFGKYTNINWTAVNSTLLHAKNLALYWLKHLYVKLVRGSNVYIKVKGPRTLLVNSSYAAFAPAIADKTAQCSEGPDGEDVEILPRSNLSEPLEPKNYLSYAIFDKGKITFHSTPDFSATVKRIKAKMN